ncbi:MAG TPA: glycosyltransferase family 2 protein [Sandaracinaceae bacterium LLY-WYZ-13_1]|nr:glycosyltransferase family 2 protein [Sandaracinaceae bacterium LLY-WYZ-13_1]
MIGQALFASVGLAGTAATLPGTLELATLTAAALRDAPGPRADPARCGKLAVVVPAHDEAHDIAACVRSLRACEVPPNGARVVVVADNCHDATASVAREAGAEVIEREDWAHRGKGYALEMAFPEVLADPEVEAVLVVDADTRVEPSLLTAAAAAFAGGADAFQCRYLIGNPGASRRTRRMHVAALAFDVVRPRGRQALGLSAGILGNGFGLHRRVVEAMPYTAHSVVEDLEYHLMIVRAGFSVTFLEETAVYADVPLTDASARSQRLRWEGGRLRMIREHAPELAGDVLRGRWRLLEPLGDLLLLPLATHVGILGLVLVTPFWPTQLYAAASLAVVTAHVATALKVGGGTREDLRVLADVPFYVLRKAGLLPSLVRASKADQDWVRTERVHGEAT